MKLTIEKIKENPTSLLRRAGYIFQRNEGAPASTRGDRSSASARRGSSPVRDGSTRGGEMSFIRPLARAGFPRFHMYAALKDFDLEISIHLDQKKETYGNNTRHHGEYEDEGALKAEVERIKSILQ